MTSRFGEDTILMEKSFRSNISAKSYFVDLHKHHEGLKSPKLSPKPKEEKCKFIDPVNFTKLHFENQKYDYLNKSKVLDNIELLGGN